MDREQLPEVPLLAVADSRVDRLNGTVCFAQTLVPVDSLFDWLATGKALTDFLECFPCVSEEQARAALDYGCRYLERAAMAASAERLPREVLLEVFAHLRERLAAAGVTDECSVPCVTPEYR